MTDLTSEQLEFIATKPSVAMITVGADGYAKPVRMGIALLDGGLVATATADRVRTHRLRSDPRCTIYFNDAEFRYLAVEARVTIVDGQAGVEESMRLVRHWQGQPEGPVTWFGQTLEPDQFRQTMLDEHRVSYRFEVVKAYGMIATP
jgi:general stress protein 26